MTDYNKLLQTAVAAALEAGQLLKSKWGGKLDIKNKGFRDLVTDADIEAQRLITKRILKRYPHHGFLAEESAPDLSSDGDVLWVIDPLDGTSNYSRSHPIFCTSIAAMERQENGVLKSIVGVIYDPLRAELFTAAAGNGSALNEKPVKVSAQKTLDGSFVGLDWSRGREQRNVILGALDGIAGEVHTVRAIGSAALALAWVACGRLDLYFNIAVGPWDVAAAKVIIEEAGGKVTDLQGGVWTPDSKSCIASNGFIHSEFLGSSAIGSQ